MNKKYVSIDKLKNKLIEFQEYEYSKDFCLVSNTVYDIFYILTRDGKVIKFLHKLNVKSQELEQYTNLIEYLKCNNKELFERYSKQIEIIIYILPRNKKTKKDLNKIYSLEDNFYFDNLYSRFKLIDNPSFKKIKNHFKKYFKLYMMFYMFYMSIYIIYMYLGISSLGIPISDISDVPSYLLLFNAFVGTLFSVVLGSLYILLLVVFFIYLLCSFLYIKIQEIEYKTLEQNFSLHFLVVKNTFKSVLMFLFVFFFILFSLILLAFPIQYFLYLGSKNIAHIENPKPINLLIEYVKREKYPKVLEINKKKFIVVGENNKYFMVYDINKTIDSLRKQEFCLDIENEKRSLGKSLYVLIDSNYNNPSSNMQYILKKDTFTFFPLSIENLDINTSKICADEKKN